MGVGGEGSEAREAGGAVIDERTGKEVDDDAAWEEEASWVDLESGDFETRE